MSEELLRLENLSIDYKVKGGYLSAVNDVNLSVHRGEILAVVGESGCGKSTIAHAIMNLLPGGNESIEGKIIFKGEDLRKYSRRQMEAIRGKDIGMIFQNPLDSLNPVYKTGKQVEEAILLDGIDRVQAWNKVLELYKDVKMPDAEVRANSFPHELSGGMRQRVMIAMMLSRNPELLIADEPTTALDVTIEAQILEIIKDLKKTYDTAIMLITHNFGLVAEVADKIAVMYAGEVIEYGDVYEIFEKPLHPYTTLLMKALPRKTKHEGRLQTIDGNVPRIMDKKPGCRFANRCPYAMDQCKDVTPPEVFVSKEHKCRCFLMEEGKEAEA
ncbi:MAG: ABC transporter ATP-binding protein [Firmicutes bacterium]|nr:ABC transporter ATP-binding protein [Bacillota bacterium]MBR0052020.1 ABC transporter ATP-binding protein [Bacillota bacterium]MBR0517745.1 ABC transporter ATP-binding protein [Bacillota bacterium]